MNNRINKVFIRNSLLFLVVFLVGCAGTMPRDNAGKPGEAVQAYVCEEAKNAECYYNLGRLYHQRGQYDKAIENLSKTVEINPRHACAYNDHAWILATCPNEKYRDGDKAVELAKKAVELSHTVPIMDTLAAAYAEAGRFEDAITTQEKVIALLKENNKSEEMLSGYKERLTAYQAHKPWRE
jgi:tetratricopeptide (TPR) repeat protein